MEKIDEPLKIIPYPDMSEIDEALLRQMVESERELWGYRWYKEYVVCPDPECRTLQSIEEVYGLDPEEGRRSLATLEKDGPKIPDCPRCGAKSELAMPTKEFTELIRSHLKMGVYGALLEDEKGGLRGHTTAFKGTRAEMLDAINYRLGYNPKICLPKISELLNDETIDREGTKDAVCISRIGIDHALRGQSFYAKLTKALLDIHPEYDDLPIMSDTRYDTLAYPLLKAMGYEVIQEDPFGNILILYPSCGDMRKTLSLPKAEFQKLYQDKLAGLRLQREQTIQNLEAGKAHKRYFGVPSLKQMIASMGRDSNAEDHHKGTPLPKPAEAREKEGDFIIEKWNQPDFSLPENVEMLCELTDAYRYIFCNAFKQFLFYPSDRKPISPQKAFGLDAQELVSLDKLDAFDPDQYPAHPVTGEKALLWHDPKTTHEAIRGKLHKKGHVSLMRDGKTNEIVGFSFGYFSTPKEIFESEEWENPFRYSLCRDKKYYRSFDHFMVKLQEALMKHKDKFKSLFDGEIKVHPDTPIYAWNAVATLPQVRGMGHILSITDGQFSQIPQELHDKLLVIGESQYGTKAYGMFEARGAELVRGVLDDDTKPLEKHDAIMEMARLSDFIKGWALPDNNHKT